ncbi:hypothetical protein GCM10010910_09700 [Microbacterium nanhaiense]|uniref:Uncharacterized protein n=2 Tax=Microbacterium nanhaiense TaxID=1301026 RepID=A0ABQ2MZI1_9MICO|nr:hypothetical protein GCM10010910_09700 [Microbacterium nanhaiense]
MHLRGNPLAQEVIMPTFYDPGADAGEASEALRGLAHASRTFEHPRDLYGVLGDVLYGVRSLRQVLDQLARAHVENRPRAFDDHGGHEVGSKAALDAADELHQAATLIDQVEDRLDKAHAASGRVAWRDEPAVEQVTVKRWVSICFLQGEEADEVLELIDDEGVDAAMSFLKNWDYGDETTDAALENGYVYDLPPTGPLEQEVRDGDYDMTYSHSFGHVGLYRLHEIPPEDAVDKQAELAQSGPTNWFEHPGIAAVKRERGLGL